MTTTTNTSNNNNTNEEPPYRITCYFYSARRRGVEQSLDVYEPCSSLLRQQKPTTVILVMGSGWLGHAWWIYRLTNWWNASGPATLARLGYRCISVRHSGGFFQLPPLSVLTSLWIFLCATVLAQGHGSWCWPTDDANTRQERDQMLEHPWSYMSSTGMLHLLYTTLAYITFWMFLYWQRQGVVDSLDEMVQDVSDALHFIYEDLGYSDRPVILGGYSSGGHVVATLLARQEYEPLLKRTLNEKRHSTTSNPEPQPPQLNPSTQKLWIQGICYISGVLSLDSWVMNAVTLAVFGVWAGQISSPHGGPSPPAWFRYLVLGCRHETFGLPVLHASLCAQRFCTWLQQECQIPACCVLVDSNHWSILSSPKLSDALEQHLPWLEPATQPMSNGESASFASTANNGTANYTL